MAKTTIYRKAPAQHETLSIRIKKRGKKQFKKLDIIRGGKE